VSYVAQHSDSTSAIENISLAVEWDVNIDVGIDMGFPSELDICESYYYPYNG
jgi:hypothetical protein